jgi:hypothetical protein
VVAVHLDGYEFLPETADRSSERDQEFDRIGVVHEHLQEHQHLQEKAKASTSVTRASLRVSQP